MNVVKAQGFKVELERFETYEEKKLLDKENKEVKLEEFISGKLYTKEKKIREEAVDAFIKKSLLKKKKIIILKHILISNKK